jgi:integrase
LARFGKKNGTLPPRKEVACLQRPPDGSAPKEDTFVPKTPDPWYRSNRGWYVQINGRQTLLGPHPDGFPPPKKLPSGKWNVPKPILDAFFSRMSGHDHAADPIAPSEGGTLVVSILDEFLDWLAMRVAEKSKAQLTYDWYFRYLQDFTKFVTPKYVIASLTIDELRPFQVTEWADSHPGWITGKRGAIVAIQRVMNWAAKCGKLATIGGKSPLAGMEKNAAGRREQLIAESEYRQILSHVKIDFSELLQLSWESGARPHELFTVEAAFVDLQNARWVFPIKLSKGKKVQRVVYLSEKALEITRRVMAKYPDGPMLRNASGAPWCRNLVKCRFHRLKKRLGVRYNLYGFRHAYITQSLVNGLDAVTVSILAGHTSTAMISRHYSHLNQMGGHMRDAANKARTKKDV